MRFFAGTSGDDVIDGGTAETISVTGYDGNDTITGSPGRDFIDGNSGDDQINGGDGNDILRGSDGDDTINGGGGDDIINDGEGEDVVDAGDGIDTYTRNFDPTQTFFTENGQTWVPHIDLVNEGIFSPTYPGIKGDVLKNFENVIIEGQSDVIVTGDNINNQITTGFGDDQISGSDGDDTINGGAGDDQIYGGAGDDTYIFEYLGDDTINDSMGVNTLSINGDVWEKTYREGDDFITKGTTGTVTYKDAFLTDGLTYLSWGSIWLYTSISLCREYTRYRTCHSSRKGFWRSNNY